MTKTITAGGPGRGDLPGPGPEHQAAVARRDFLFLASAATGAVAVAAGAWPMIDSMNPAADTRAMATVEVDLSPVAVGQAITVAWQGKPVFIRHRTPTEIETARAVPLTELRDPATDADRTQRPDWLVAIGICTHLGCVPKGQSAGEPRGDYDGWFCVCHGSHYDTAGRIRKGPAPRNLVLPPYAFVNDTTLRLG